MARGFQWERPLGRRPARCSQVCCRPSFRQEKLGTFSPAPRGVAARMAESGGGWPSDADRFPPAASRSAVRRAALFATVAIDRCFSPAAHLTLRPEPPFFSDCRRLRRLPADDERRGSAKQALPCSQRNRSSRQAQRFARPSTAHGCGAAAQGLRPRYSRKTPRVTAHSTSAKPARRKASRMLAGSTARSIVSP